MLPEVPDFWMSVSSISTSSTSSSSSNANGSSLSAFGVLEGLGTEKGTMLSSPPPPSLLKPLE